MDFTHTNLPIETSLPKLVRDNIPQIIATNDGKEPNVIVANNDKEYLNYLLKKIVEEAAEVQNHQEKLDLIKELADVKEVTLAITQLMKISEEEIEKVRQEKKDKNGSFDKRYILVSK